VKWVCRPGQSPSPPITVAHPEPLKTRIISCARREDSVFGSDPTAIVPAASIPPRPARNSSSSGDVNFHSSCALVSDRSRSTSDRSWSFSRVRPAFSLAASILPSAAERTEACCLTESSHVTSLSPANRSLSRFLEIIRPPAGQGSRASPQRIRPGLGGQYHSALFKTVLAPPRPSWRCDTDLTGRQMHSLHNMREAAGSLRPSGSRRWRSLKAKHGHPEGGECLCCGTAESVLTGRQTGARTSLHVRSGPPASLTPAPTIPTIDGGVRELNVAARRTADEMRLGLRRPAHRPPDARALQSMLGAGPAGSDHVDRHGRNLHVRRIRLPGPRMLRGELRSATHARRPRRATGQLLVLRSAIGTAPRWSGHD
jgi:hypothetical protein